MLMANQKLGLSGEPDQIWYSTHKQGIGPEGLTLAPICDVNAGDCLGIITTVGHAWRYYATVCRHTYISAATAIGNNFAYLHNIEGLKVGDVLKFYDSIAPATETHTIAVMPTVITPALGWKVEFGPTDVFAAIMPKDTTEAFIDDGSQNAVAVATEASTPFSLNEKSSTPIVICGFLNDPSRDPGYIDDGTGLTGDTNGGLRGVVSNLSASFVNTKKLNAVGFSRKTIGTITYFDK